MAMSSQFGHPGGMPGHGGMPHGHPMAPGHPSNQGVPNGGQPGVTMGQQMHAMGSGPQVTQGPMMGISQGGPGVSGGPSAHAMQHLNPAINPQLIQNQQQMHAGAACKCQPFSHVKRRYCLLHARDLPITFILVTWALQLAQVILHFRAWAFSALVTTIFFSLT